MSLSKLVEDMVKVAMDSVGDLAEKGDYISLDPTTTYDPITDSVTKNSTTYSSVTMVLAKFKSSELTNKIVVETDAKLIIAKKDLAVTPKEADQVVINSQTWYVEDILSAPSYPVWILHVRRA